MELKCLTPPLIVNNDLISNGFIFITFQVAPNYVKSKLFYGKLIKTIVFVLSELKPLLCCI